LSPTALVLGGYGVFGRRVVESLARHPQVSVIVAGRSLRAADALCRSLGSALVRPLQLDCGSREFAARLAELRPAVVVDAVGPFQGRDYAVARACIEAGAHCVDLADGRDYVTNIGSLDSAARIRDVLVASGASTCPAVSTAVMDLFVRELEDVSAAALGIAPGQKAPRGLAAARAVLGYCGKPIPALKDGGRMHVYGWSGLSRHAYPAPIGRRWLSTIDVPETQLWPGRYRSLRSILPRAGLESSTLHLGLSALSKLVRLGVIRSLEPHARSMLRVAKLFEPFGHAVGAMHVSATGRIGDRMVKRTWSMVAEHGSGPQIPACPTAALTKKLLRVPGYAPLNVRGAMPCIGLLSLDEILHELARFPIRTAVQDEPVDSSRSPR